MNDHMAKKLQLDLLKAEANLHADKILRGLHGWALPDDLTETYENWKVVQDEIDILLNKDDK
jgi:hypothetical protein